MIENHSNLISSVLKQLMSVYVYLNYSRVERVNLPLYSSGLLEEL